MKKMRQGRFPARARGPSGHDPCRENRWLAPLVAAGLASEVECEQVRRHAAACPVCLAYLDQAAGLARALVDDALEIGCLPPGAPDAAAARIAENVSNRLRRAERRSTWLTPWRLGAAVCVAAIGLITAASRTPDGPGVPWLIVTLTLYAIAAAIVVPLMLIPRHLTEEEES
ncbi:MAG: hypothetical protein C4551_05885 [Bacillota bacterium]|nr:MAG: hypothetical protein C4551_05885 [Bacillota bacterium]